MGDLYIVATPIGNLQDITIRAIETLNFVDLIISEDTRKSGILIKSVKERFNAQIKSPKFISYFEQNEQRKIPDIISLLKQGLNIALVSDAGTPTISDPGYKLVRECVTEKIKVISVPGPTSVIAALVSSGLPTDKFTFLGFLPKKEAHRISILKKCQEISKILKTTFIIFVAPHDLLETLKEIKESIGDIELVISREITKIHEETLKGTASELILNSEKKPLKGEIVLLFNLG
jgi:16S rRNA (cytidine1402-2'-O)-methyltransferase